MTRLLLLIPLLLAPVYSDAQSSPQSPPTSALYGMSSSFSPSTSIIVVVLISAIFLIGFLSIYLRRGDYGDRTAETLAAAARSRRQGGLDPDLLATFPTLVYSEAKGLKIGKGSLECAVCLSEFEDEETLRLLPRCCHVFHPDCIDSWLASHVTCPVCRSNIAETLTSAAADDSYSTASADPPPALTEEPRTAEISPPEQVAITIADQGEETAELARIARRMRSKSRLPRSRSTGSSLATVRLGDNFDRFTLRLPEHVKEEIVAAGKFHRAESVRAFPTEGSSRRGYRGGAEGSSRGGRSIRADRWPSFLARTLSSRFAAAFSTGKRWDGEGSSKKGVGEGSTRGKLASVRPPFDCLGGGGGGAKSDALIAGDDESASRV